MVDVLGFAPKIAAKQRVVQ